MSTVDKPEEKQPSTPSVSSPRDDRMDVVDQDEPMKSPNLNRIPSRSGSLEAPKPASPYPASSSSMAQQSIVLDTPTLPTNVSHATEKSTISRKEPGVSEKSIVRPRNLGRMHSLDEVSESPAASGAASAPRERSPKRDFHEAQNEASGGSGYRGTSAPPAAVEHGANIVSPYSSKKLRTGRSSCASERSAVVSERSDLDPSYVFRKLKEADKSNSYCSDCRDRIPSTDAWASLQHAVFLCSGCCGLHRALGVHVSRVKSIQYDNWSDEELRIMLCGGNARFRQYMHSCHNGVDQHPTLEERILEQFQSKAAERYRLFLRAKARGEPTPEKLSKAEGSERFEHYAVPVAFRQSMNRQSNSNSRRPTAGNANIRTEGQGGGEPRRRRRFCVVQ